MSCVDPDVILRLELGECSAEEAERVERHLATCERCRAERLATSRLLRDLETTRIGERDADGFVLGVMEACEEAAARPAARTSKISILAPVGVALAMAAGAALWIDRAPSDGPVAGLTPRGSSAFELPVTRVEAFAGRALPSRAPALLEGAELRPGDGIAVRYSNGGDREAFLMVFAVDSAGQVHWIHPAYLSESENPSSIRLEPRTESRILDEIAEPEGAVPGPLRVYAVVSAEPLKVKDVEARLSSAKLPVADLFPEAAVDEWRCTWRNR